MGAKVDSAVLRSGASKQQWELWRWIQQCGHVVCAGEHITSAKVDSADEHATNAWVRMWTMLCCVVVQAAVGAGDEAGDAGTSCACWHEHATDAWVRR